MELKNYPSDDPEFDKWFRAVYPKDAADIDKMIAAKKRAKNSTAARLAAAERLKVAASKAAEALHELGHDAYNDLAMALVDFERKNGEIE